MERRLQLAANSIMFCVCVFHSYSCALSGPSGQREVFGLYNSVLLQHGHQDVRGVCLLGLRRKQQQLCVTAELCGRVCSRYEGVN